MNSNKDRKKRGGKKDREMWYSPGNVDMFFSMVCSDTQTLTTPSLYHTAPPQLTHTCTTSFSLQTIIAALIRAQLAWGIMVLPWKPREGVQLKTSGGFNLGLVKIQLIKSETWQDKQHSILSSHWSQCSLVVTHIHTQTWIHRHIHIM